MVAPTEQHPVLHIACRYLQHVAFADECVVYIEFGFAVFDFLQVKFFRLGLVQHIHFAVLRH